MLQQKIIDRTEPEREVKKYKPGPSKKLFYLRDVYKHVLGFARSKKEFITYYSVEEKHNKSRKLPPDKLEARRLEPSKKQLKRLEKVLEVDWERTLDSLARETQGFFYDIIATIEEDGEWNKWKRDTLNNNH